MTDAVTPSPSIRSRAPTGKLAEIAAPRAATTVAVPSPSSRNRPQSTFPSMFAASSATFANTSPGDSSSATSVATRRSAACSSASRASASRASALAIAVARSSVKSERPASMPGRKGAPPGLATQMTPHGRSSTRMGTPTAERPPAADREAGVIDRGDHGGVRIRVVSIDRHYVNAEDLRHFSCGQGEYVRLGFALYAECRDPSQRRLLLGELYELGCPRRDLRLELVPRLA